MPELPEVETVRRILVQQVVGKKIQDVVVNYNKMIKNVSPLEFASLLNGKTIKDIVRKGKYLIFVFDKLIMLSHLRMEGKYLLNPSKEFSPHDHVIFCFNDGSQLRYNDTRKFGTMHIFKDISINELQKIEPLNRVGLDPFDKEFNLDYLKKQIKNLNRSIKSVLLDQKIVSGLGNIYVDETLFLSKIHPTSNVKFLTDDKLINLIRNMQIILNKAIEYGGTTVKSFKASDEISGRFQNFLLIHTKSICPECELPIKKIRVAGRGTYACGNCQENLNPVLVKD